VAFFPEKSLDMAESNDDVMASWRDRVGTLRKPGRVSAAALTVVPPEEIDVRRGRPAAPERLSEAERDLWKRLTFSRRPGWFAGAEAILESYVVAVTQAQLIEAALRKAKPIAGARHARLARMHRQAVAVTASLATKLKLVPSSRLDRRTPQDGNLPVA
jgi:hypothetical protein